MSRRIVAQRYAFKTAILCRSCYSNRSRSSSANLEIGFVVKNESCSSAPDIERRRQVVDKYRPHRTKRSSCGSSPGSERSAERGCGIKCCTLRALRALRRSTGGEGVSVCLDTSLPWAQPRQARPRPRSNRAETSEHQTQEPSERQSCPRAPSSPDVTSSHQALWRCPGRSTHAPQQNCDRHIRLRVDRPRPPIPDPPYHVPSSIHPALIQLSDRPRPL